ALDDRLHDEQAEAHAALLGLFFAAAAAEALEAGILLQVAQAGAFVFDPEEKLAVVDLAADAELGPGRGELAGAGEEVHEDLDEARGVAGDGGEREGEVYLDALLAQLREGRGHLDG